MGSTNWVQFLADIFNTVLIPLMGVLAVWLVRLIDIKMTAAAEESKNELASKYILMLKETVIHCVEATNQTYVDGLKKQGKFDAEAQKEAFKMTLGAVTDILSDDAKKYLNEACGDLNKYITELIESTVKNVKTNIA